MKMEEYVAKSVLKKELNIANLHSGIVSALQNIVDEIPAADVQEVVKCKDCVYATYMLRDKDDEPVIWCCERMMCILSDENSYCSWAKRKAQPIRKDDGK